MANVHFETFTKSESDFINERTRQLMVRWCDTSIQYNGAEAPWKTPGYGVYLRYAKAKGWISADGSRILSSGWATAARFLRR